MAVVVWRSASCVESLGLTIPTVCPSGISFAWHGIVSQGLPSGLKKEMLIWLPPAIGPAIEKLYRGRQLQVL